jgi:hypothetical protein
MWCTDKKMTRARNGKLWLRSFLQGEQIHGRRRRTKVLHMVAHFLNRR